MVIPFPDKTLLEKISAIEFKDIQERVKSS